WGAGRPLRRVTPRRRRPRGHRGHGVARGRRRPRPRARRPHPVQPVHVDLEVVGPASLRVQAAVHRQTAGTKPAFYPPAGDTARTEHVTTEPEEVLANLELDLEVVALRRDAGS